RSSVTAPDAARVAPAQRRPFRGWASPRRAMAHALHSLARIRTTMEGLAMNISRAFCISFVIAMGAAAPVALANTNTPTDDTAAGHTYVQPLPKAQTLADNVVVSPNPPP